LHEKKSVACDRRAKRIFHRLVARHPSGNILDNVLKAMDAARDRGIPVFVIQHTSPLKNAETFRKRTESWELHPEILRRTHDHYIEKNFPDFSPKHRFNAS
jgi:nicotinamidase-related amidase